MKHVIIIILFAVRLSGVEANKIIVTIGQSDMTNADRIEMFLMAFDELSIRDGKLPLAIDGKDIVSNSADFTIVIRLSRSYGDKEMKPIIDAVTKKMRAIVERRFSENISVLLRKVETIKAALLKETDHSRRVILEVYLRALIPPTDRVPRPPDPVSIIVD